MKRIEKDTIQKLRKFVDKMRRNKQDITYNHNDDLLQDIETVLNYIEKLQEENEQMKLEKNSRVIGKYGEIEVHNLIEKVLSEEYIPKQTIIEKIKEIERAKIAASLLVENRIIIADSDSLYKGQEIAHDYDIAVLNKLLEEK